MCDDILNRLSEIKEFIELNELQRTKVVNAFENNYFDYHSGITYSSGRTFIRVKGEVLDMNKYSDSYLIFWVTRILDLPLATIIVNK